MHENDTGIDSFPFTQELACNRCAALESAWAMTGAAAMQ
jgi:hypothetical protein